MSIELKAQNRTILGKKVKPLRAEGLIPAEIFGHGLKNKHISVAKDEFARAYKKAGENTVIELLIGEEKTSALISHVAQNYISGETLAIDFYHIKKGEKIRTHVSIEYIGTDTATKAGFVLVKVTSQLEVEALPENIPHSFKIDVSALQESGQYMEVKDIKIPEGIKLFVAPDTVLVTVSEKAKEEVVVAPVVEEENEKKGEEKKDENETPANEEKK